jgi:putative FmdB family regulatory protein
MPLYEYRCKKCGHRFEKIQSFSAPDEKECPVCGSEVEKLISAPAIQFKGAGWYVTDYASKSNGGASKSSGSSGDSKPAASSENKPAATSESKTAATSSAAKSD